MSYINKYSEWFRGQLTSDDPDKKYDVIVKPAAATGEGEKKKSPTCKICCACPIERRDRDECVLLRGRENCNKEIEAFYKCLATEGFTKEDIDKLRKGVRT
eukprot:PhF_6_TR32651/c0_g1_i1/m.48248/K02260/COX17; cytochrome c oxidase assembly protein subunit 17